MSPQRLGKFNHSTLDRLIYRHLGRQRREVLVGPRFGVDNSVQSLGNGEVLVATCDPLSFIPELDARDSAWLSVNLLASDLTTSGLMPQFGIFDLNLPPKMKNSEFEQYWDAFCAECNRLGISIVGGHTGRYQGCDYTVIGAGVLYAVGDENRYLVSSMARTGDNIILTKGAAVETTAILARVFPDTVKNALGAYLFKKAWESLACVSTVKDALAAVSIGFHGHGVTAMHDATEGGVISAVMELAYASNLGAELNLSEIHVPEETEKICKLFHIDPLKSLSEGSLIVACRPQHTQRLLDRLRKVRIDSYVIGVLTSKTYQVFATSKNHKRVPMQYPRLDPYWNAYWKAYREHWK